MCINTCKRLRNQYTLIVGIMLLVSCKAYRQDVMFQTTATTELESQIEMAEDNYRLQPNDWLKVNVFSNEGEQLIDPNFVFPNEQGQGAANQQFIQVRENQRFLVQADGTIKLPIVDQINVEGLTIDKAEDLLEKKYSAFFKDPFVKLQFLNKRVIVLAAEQSQVIPITNENTSLPEVLALAGGVQFGSKAQNIRVVRGNLQNPEIYEIDMSTVEGMRNSIIRILPGDVIYIEPWRRPWREAVRDASPVLGVFTSVATLVFLIINATTN